jgi:DNA-binding response OmpR family regulator
VRARVLLVDDSEPVRLTLTALLEDAGYAVVEAATLEHARALLSATPGVDLVLLDLGLPDGRGTELLPDIRGAQPHARVAVLSGSAGEAVAGAHAVLEKAAAPAELLARIAQLLEAAR